MSKEKKEQKKVSTSLQDKESVGFFAYWLDKTKKFLKKVSINPKVRTGAIA